MRPEHKADSVEVMAAMGDKSHSNVRWWLVSVLFLLSAVTYLDRVNLSIAGSSIIGEYHLTELQLGWMLSAFLIGYGLFQAPAGRLADRCGPRLALAGGACWWAIFTVLATVVPRGVASALWILISIRFLLGVGEAILYPASSLFVARWIPITDRGRANGIIFAGVGVGAGVTPPIVAYVMHQDGWRASFWVCASIGLVIGCVWYWLARDNPEEHPRISSSEVLFIHRGIVDRTEASECGYGGTSMISWREILKSWQVWALTISYFCFGYVAWLFFSWFYIYLATVRGMDLKASAMYAMLPFIAMAVGSTVGGVLSDKITQRWGLRVGRCSTAFAGLALAAVFIIIGSQIRSAGLASLVLSGGAGTLYLAQSSFWSVSADIARGSSGSVSGFMNMGAQVGGALTASLTPWIALHYGWGMSFAIAGTLSVFGAALWLSVNPASAISRQGVTEA
ncbi:MAG TPA: MFS transporter [Nitrospira sp.]|nr:MFS transporter [Nitrospira sp.]